MFIDFATLSTNQVYHLMTQTLIPRPVAWVLSENRDQSYNVAPFSYFTAVSSNPPLIMISVGKKPDGSFKDTRVNIEERQRFVIHICHRELAGAMTETSRTLPYGDSELTRAGLDIQPFGDFPLPRLKECRVAYACSLHQIMEIGATPQTLIFGQVEGLYVDDQIVSEAESGRLTVHADRVDPVGRLGADEYASFGEILRIPRPT
jgi:flavin reductase (DIM6/NTAB) family NADH-FMN oxidoreductase RutF